MLCHKKKLVLPETGNISDPIKWVIQRKERALKLCRKKVMDEVGYVLLLFSEML